MGSPYLNSGETIILTTDRVIADEVQYDVILTSQRLALVDSSHTRDQPQVIPFATILSVKGGMTPALEPGITLVLTDASGGAGLQEITLVFSQQPYEDRAPERDRWVKTLIDYIVRVRQEAPLSGKRPAPEITGTQPSVRRWVAPEIPQPHADVAPVQKEPSGMILTRIQEIAWEAPVEGEAAAEAKEDTVPAGEVVPADREEQALEKAQEETVLAGEGVSADREEEAGSHGTGTPAAPERWEYPAVLEGEEEWAAEDAPGISPEPAVPEADSGEAAGAVAVADEGSPETAAARNEELPAGTAQEPALPDGAARPADQTDAAPDIRIGVPAHVVFPVITVPDSIGNPAGGISRETPQELTPEPAAGAEQGSTSAIQTGLQDTVVVPIVTAREPETLPEHQVSPSPLLAPRPKRDMIMVVAAIAFILIVIACGAFVGFRYLAEKNTVMTGPTVTPAPVVVQPSGTPAVIIPANGVWVRVMYNGTYAGSVGNAGDLKLVSGTGDQFYYIRDSSGLVQATFQKQDQTGETLTVGVYTNGTEVTYRTVRAPRGSISLLVDPQTGKPPYLPVAAAQ